MKRKTINDSEILNRNSLCKVRELYNLPCVTCVNYLQSICPKEEKKVYVSKKDMCEIDGESHTFEQWAKMYNITTRLITSRYKRGARGKKLLKASRKDEDSRVL